jgi:hypothetical protein
LYIPGAEKFFFAIPRTSQAQRKKVYVTVYGDKSDGTRVMVWQLTWKIPPHERPRGKPNARRLKSVVD